VSDLKIKNAISLADLVARPEWHRAVGALAERVAWELDEGDAAVWAATFGRGAVAMWDGPLARRQTVWRIRLPSQGFR
jgi:hypothetical protein